MALRTEVVNLIRSDVENQVCQALTVRQIAVVKKQPRTTQMRVLIDVIYSACVKRAGSPYKAVHYVSFIQQEFRQI